MIGIAVILIGIGTLCAPIGLLLLGRECDERLTRLSRAVRALDDRAEDAEADARLLHCRVDCCVDAGARIERSLSIALKDSDRAYSLALQCPQVPDPHAPCALCGKQGHVADMERLTCADAMGAGLHDHVAHLLDAPAKYYHPTCLVEAGYEHVESVAGGWRKKEVVV